MRRVNIQDAFVGEPSLGSEGLHAAPSDEAVTLNVRGGEVTVVVPEGTPDDGVLAAASTVRGTLHLENERVLSFEIHDGAVGAFVEDEAADLHQRREASGTVGLFSLGSTPRGGEAGPVRARDLMRPQPITTAPEVPVEEVAALLAFHRITGCPVVQNGRVVGLVSEADVIGKQGRTVGDIMTREVISVGEDTPCEEIATLLTSRRIRRLPVMRGEELVGIVSRGDIVRWVGGAQG